MQLYELMSDGTLVSLPETAHVEGLPLEMTPLVLVWLPFNRALAGTAMVVYESWFYGKVGGRLWREVQLYPHTLLRVHEPGVGEIKIPSQTVDTLIGLLRAHIAPPGDHEMSLLLLNEYLKPFNAFKVKVASGFPFCELPENLTFLRTAYWGIRSALQRGERGSLQRICQWLRLARDAFDSESKLPLMWGFLNGIPTQEVFERLCSVGFTIEQLRQLDIDDSNPAVLRCDGGYLLQYWDDFQPLSALAPAFSVRFWYFVPAPLWKELKGRLGLSIKDIVLCCWGYLEALEAERSLSAYKGENNPYQTKCWDVPSL